MAVLELTYRSNVLDFDQNLTVMLPEPSNLSLMDRDGPLVTEFPVLYLLHGYSDDHTSWLRRSSVERYLTMDFNKPLVIVCPSVQNSFYEDMVHGWRYYTYLTEEVPELLSRWIRISRRPEDTFIAGLSMGGYGAMKIGLRHPERFAAVASFSGVLNLPLSGEVNEERDNMTFNVFGMKRTETKGTDYDVFHLLDKAIESGKKLPKLYSSCGTADFHYENNLSFRDYALSKGDAIDYTYSETEGMEHEWKFWDAEIRKLLNWLPLRDCTK